MLFMKEQRSQVVQECTLRESAAINQILGRKVRSNKIRPFSFERISFSGMNLIVMFNRNTTIWHVMNVWNTCNCILDGRHEIIMVWKRNASKKERNEIKHKVKIISLFSSIVSFHFRIECLNQKKCRARFGLEQQVHWCKHCKRKKKCLRYAENETTVTWSDEDDTDSNDGDLILTNTLDSDEENKSRLLRRI